MCKRHIAGALIAIALMLVATPVVSAANISDVEADDYTINIESSQADTHDIQVTNSGENDTAADVTITSTPSGVSVSHAGSENLAAGTTTDVTLRISVGSNPESGRVSGSVNGESFSFDLTVAPQAGFSDEPIDVGEVLVGNQATETVSVEELTNEGSLRGVNIDVISGDSDGSLAISGENTVSGSGGTVEVTVQPDSGADQYETLRWTLKIADDRSSSVTREVNLEAEVIYPGYFGELDIDSDEFRFDEPRSGGATLTKEIDLNVPNDGDTPLEVGSVSASSSNPDISVVASGRPAEIDQRTTTEVDLRITAEKTLPEGGYDFSVTATTPGAGGDATLDDNFEIIHETSLASDDVSIGDLAIGETTDRETTIREELGYKSVDDVETTLETGPDKWLTLESAPNSVGAGSAEDASLNLEFDTSAEFGETYEWVYSVDGEGGSTRITVTATPVPLDLGPIQSDLSEYDSSVADSTLTLIDTMDSRLRSGKSSNEEISIVLTFGEATVLYIEAVNEAETHLQDDEHDQAQSAIIRAAAAYNTMGLQANRLESDEVRQLSDTARADAESDLDRVITQQQTYYEDRLESGDMSLIEEATTQRQLARIALLQGDEERADELQDNAETAFNSYSESVSSGEQSRQDAESTWTEMRQTQFVVVLGQPLLLNPAKYDTFVADAESIDTAYQNAIDAFENAGETTRAQEIAAERQSRAAALDIARVSVFGAVGVYALVVIWVTVRTSRRLFHYIRDARESVSGDFLV